MKKLIYVVGVVFLMLAVVAQGAIIKEVEIVQTSGSTAYNANGTLTWSMGSSGFIILDDGSFVGFEKATVSATFTGMTDLSSGGVARATFDTGLWTVDLVQDAAEVHMAGSIIGLYREQEVVPSDEVALDGYAVIHLDYANFTGFGDTFVWGNGDMLGSIMASVAFTPGYVLNNYQIPYFSENATMTFFADENAVPEPATMLLLGLGAALLRKKK